MSEITDRELALAQLKSIDDVYNAKGLKPIIKHFDPDTRSLLPLTKIYWPS